MLVVARYTRHDDAIILFVGLSVSFAGVVANWCEILRTRWRYLAGATILFADGVALSYVSREALDVLLILVPLAIGTVVVVTLEIAKLRFGDFRVFDIAEPKFNEGLRFRISHILILTSIVAALSAVGRVLWPNLVFDNYPATVLLMIAAIVSSTAINTLVAVWGLMGRELMFRFVVMLMLQIGVSMLGYVFFQHLSVAKWLLLNGAIIGGITVHLLLLRSAGYRFVRLA